MINSTFYDPGSSFDSLDDIHVSGASVQITFATCYNGGLGTDNGGTIALRNTIVFGDATCEGAPASFIDAGKNLQFAVVSSCPVTIPVKDPLLDSKGLQNNGEPTKTIALRKGSPAIDAIGIKNCTDQNGKLVLIDQRGFGRPATNHSRCDVGAYEYGGH